MASDPKRPSDSGDVQFDDWDSALDEWDAHFESVVEGEAPRVPARSAAGLASPAGGAAAAIEIEAEPAEADDDDATMVGSALPGDGFGAAALAEIDAEVELGGLADLLEPPSEPEVRLAGAPDEIDGEITGGEAQAQSEGAASLDITPLEVPTVRRLEVATVTPLEVASLTPLQVPVSVAAPLADPGGLPLQSLFGDVEELVAVPTDEGTRAIELIAEEPEAIAGLEWLADDDIASEEPVAPPAISSGPMITPDELAALEDPEAQPEVAPPPGLDAIAETARESASVPVADVPVAAGRAVVEVVDDRDGARAEAAAPGVAAATAAAVDVPPPRDPSTDSLSAAFERAFDQVNLVEPPEYDWPDADAAPAAATIPVAQRAVDGSIATLAAEATPTDGSADAGAAATATTSSHVEALQPSVAAIEPEPLVPLTAELLLTPPAGAEASGGAVAAITIALDVDDEPLPLPPPGLFAVPAVVPASFDESRATAPDPQPALDEVAPLADEAVVVDMVEDSGPELLVVEPDPIEEPAPSGSEWFRVGAAPADEAPRAIEPVVPAPVPSMFAGEEPLPPMFAGQDAASEMVPPMFAGQEPLADAPGAPAGHWQDAAAAPGELPEHEAPSHAPPILVALPPVPEPVLDAPRPSSRLPVTAPVPVLSVADLVPPPRDPVAERESRQLFDEERQHATTPARKAALACAAARSAERVGDRIEAQRLYQAALAEDPDCLPALRAVRQLALDAGDLQTAVEVLTHEARCAPELERAPLAAVRAELLLALGAVDAAAEAWEGLRNGPLHTWARAGLVDAAVGGAGDLRAALGDLAAHVTDRDLAGALSAERGAPDGAATRSLAGAVAQLAVALRERDATEGVSRAEIESGALEPLATLAGGALGGAVVRRLAMLRYRSQRPGRLEEVVSLLAGAVDTPSLELRRQGEEQLGDTTAVEATMGRLAERASGVARCDWLVALAARAEARGDLQAASDLCERALAAAPGDLRALTIAERLDGAPGVASSRPRRAESLAERRHRARALAESGQREEAVRVLLEAQADRPVAAAMAEELADLQVAVGRTVEAGATLEAAAAVESGAASRRGQVASATSLMLLDRAARLYGAGGDLERAAATLRALGAGPLGTSARRRLANLLAVVPGAATSSELAVLLAADAAQISGAIEAAQRWYRHGLASRGHGAAAASSFQRALERDPDHAPALLALELGGDRLAAAEHRRRRLEMAPRMSPLQELALLWRCALGLDVARDPGAGELLVRARQTAGPAAVLVEDRLLDRCRATGDLAGEVTLLELRLEEGSPQERLCARLRLAERVLQRGDADGSAARLREALALDADAPDGREGTPGPDGSHGPGRLLVRAPLERLLAALGRDSELVELLGSQLAWAGEPRRRAALLERLARLHAERLHADESAERLFASILAIDHANHAAFRALERRYLVGGRDADCVALYAQMGLTATDPLLATAVILERSRLRRLLQGSIDDIENDLRQAVFKDARCRPALRQLLAIAQEAGRPAAIADVCERLAADPDMPASSAAVFLWRTADAMLALGRTAEAQRHLRSSLRLAGDQSPALRALLQLALANNSLVEAEEVAQRAVGSTRDQRAALECALIAGLLAEQRGDGEHALAAWRAALAIDATQPEAFDRVITLFESNGNDAARAEVLSLRAAAEPDPRRAASAHVDLALLYRDKLSNLAAAREHLVRALALQPAHPAALSTLADLQLRDGSWAEAAQTLIRCVRVERDPGALRDMFLHLGGIYTEYLPDSQRAITSFNRVLQYEPDHKLALEHLAALHERQGDVRPALDALVKMVTLEPDAQAQIALLLRAGRLQERQPGGDRAALDLMRRALAIDPTRVASAIAIADFFQRRGDSTSARVQLDSSSQLLRQQVARRPSDPGAYHGLFRIFAHRRATDAAWLAASVLDVLGKADSDESATLTRNVGRDQPVRTALASNAIDELLFDSAIPGGFRSLLSRLDEPLAKVLRGDVKRFGVGRGDRVPKVHLVREVGTQVAADLGLREPEIYIARAHPSLLAVELTDPVSLIVGERLVAGAGERELRFLFARQLKLVQSGLGAVVRAGVDEIGLLAGGLVRQFVAEYAPPGYDVRAVAQEQSHLSRVLSRKQQQELMPFAFECSAPNIDWREVYRHILRAGDRAGLLAAGSVQAAVAAARRLGDDAAAVELLRFAVSEELVEMRLLGGVAIS